MRPRSLSACSVSVNSLLGLLIIHIATDFNGPPLRASALGIRYLSTASGVNTLRGRRDADTYIDDSETGFQSAADGPTADDILWVDSFDPADISAAESILAVPVGMAAAASANSVSVLAGMPYPASEGTTVEDPVVAVPEFSSEFSSDDLSSDAQALPMQPALSPADPYAIPWGVPVPAYQSQLSRAMDATPAPTDDTSSVAALKPKSPSAPHIVIILADDLGWNGVGYNNAELHTPNIDKLAKNGSVLKSHYAYRTCATSRGSLLTGRAGFQLESTRGNLPTERVDAISSSYTMLPASLKAAGYSTHMVGKWHQGFHSPEYTPTHRGFDSFFGYLSGTVDHWSQVDVSVKCPWGYPVSLMNDSAPAHGKNGTYGDFQFTSRAVEVIRAHNLTHGPLFMYVALQNTHGPMQAPEEYAKLYRSEHVEYAERRNAFDGMVSVVDDSVGRIVTSLREKGMWEDTILLWTSDNGAAVDHGGSNDPLRGGKGSNWDGGVRVPAFLAGGRLPESARGRHFDGLMSIADWYATFAGLAGAEPGTDGLAPSDSIDQWPYLSGAAVRSPRTELVHDHFVRLPNALLSTEEKMDDSTTGRQRTFGAMRSGHFKLIVGTEWQATWLGQFSPNASFVKTVAFRDSKACENSVCLFNIVDDPTEHIDLSRDRWHVPVLVQMLERWRDIEAEYHPGLQIQADETDQACEAWKLAGGFIVPWRKTGQSLLANVTTDTEQTVTTVNSLHHIMTGDKDVGLWDEAWDEADEP